MDKLKEYIIKEVRDSREELLSVSSDILTWQFIKEWYLKWKRAFSRAEGVSAHLIHTNLQMYMNGFDRDVPIDVLIDLRDRIIKLLDSVIIDVDSRQTIVPILDSLIVKVQDQKLAALLSEFNRIKDTSPNFAAIGFRTILTLLIKERAKKVNPNSQLATKGDLGFEPDIKKAIGEHIFSSAEEKLLDRYLTGGKKDANDNVAHKPGSNTIVNKDDLEDSVNLLNKLLPTIIS